MADDDRTAPGAADPPTATSNGRADTIDWEDYWDDVDDPKTTDVDANPSAEYVRDPLLAFLDATDDPGSYADVGCGTGSVVFAVRDRYPDATVHGYDAAEPILASNRDRARNAGYGDVRFERTVLPAFEPGRRFDVVSSFFTLCYVAETEQALGRLYDAVEPGGALVFTYHNRFASAFYGRAVESPHDYFDESFPGDPDRFYERFRLVVEGESLLSYDRIHEALGTWPRSLWSVAADAERYGASRAIPLVYVPK